MNYWLTTHHPHRRPDIPYFIYLPKEPKPGGGPAVGDTVFFYQTVAGGPGKAQGAGAIIQAGTVTGEPRAVRGDYADGRPFEIPCDSWVVPHPLPLGRLKEMGGPKSLLSRTGLFLLEPTAGERIKAAVKAEPQAP